MTRPIIHPATWPLLAALLVSGCASRPAPVPSPPPPSAPAPEAVPEPPSSPVTRADVPVRPPPSPVTPPPSQCEIGGDEVNLVRTVALTDPVDPAHVPRPTNRSEHLLFRQLYDTLIRVDCDGRVRPGVARTWTRAARVRTWRLTLDETARFWDGSPVTPADVVASWRGLVRAGQPVGGPVEAVTIVDGRSLEVTLAAEVDEPLVLAAPALAVVRPGRRGWPEGTTALRVVDHRAAGPGDTGTVILGRVPDDPEAISVAPVEVIRFEVAAGADPRDRLDAPVDLMVSDHHLALSYARSRPDLQTVPLPWRHVYAAVSPPRGHLAASSVTDDMRARLATDAVRGDARGASTPYWSTTPGCPSAAGTPVRGSEIAIGTRPRVLFRETDSVAGDLAARLVALGGFGSGDGLLAALLPTGSGRLSSLALGHQAFDDALTEGREALYLVRLDRDTLDPCQPWRGLEARAPWLRAPGVSASAAVVPLVETRAHAILRRGVGRLSLDGDGGLVLAAAREARR